MQLETFTKTVTPVPKPTAQAADGKRLDAESGDGGSVASLCAIDLEHYPRCFLFCMVFLPTFSP